MSFRKDYKTVSSFYKSGNEDIQTSCLHDFKRRIENSDNDIRNIGDINKINVKNNSVENFEINNFHNVNQNVNHNMNRDMNNYNFKTPIDKIENKTPINNFHDIKNEPNNYLTNQNYTTQNKHYNNENFEMSYTRRKYKNTSSPDVFGPPMWFTLHNGASKYPHNPGNLAKQRMKYFILGIPVMIPCTRCREDATAYIEKYKDSLDDICSSRLKLFEFFFE